MSERSRRRRWLAPTAAATGVAVVVGVLIALNRGAEPVPGRTQPPASPTTQDLLVRNGDEVVANGVVVAAPGRPVVFCPPMPQVDTGLPAGRKAEPPCIGDPRAVAVTGVHLNRLGEPDSREGVSFGYAELRGVWRDRTIAVTEQGPYTTDEAVAPVDEVPCPRPAGDWKPGHVDQDRLSAFIARQPDRFGTPWMSYVDAKEILMVGVVEGGLADARRDLAPHYDGNLCVTRTEQSIARREQVTDELEALWTDHPEAVVSTAGIAAVHNLPAVDLVVMDQRMHDVLAKIGWDQFDVDATIRPVR